VQEAKPCAWPGHTILTQQVKDSPAAVFGEPQRDAGHEQGFDNPSFAAAPVPGGMEPRIISYSLMLNLFGCVPEPHFALLCIDILEMLCIGDELGSQNGGQMLKAGRRHKLFNQRNVVDFLQLPVRFYLWL